VTTTGYRNKVEEARTTLIAGVEALQSSDDWKRALQVAAKFWRYSFNNQVLIWQQAHERGFEATQVAGYKKWRELGRQVRRGEKGLMVYVPRTKTVEENNGDKTRVLTGFGVGFVFDISQTDGEPVPSTTDFVSDDFTGRVPSASELITYIEEDLKFQFIENLLPGSIYGQTDYGTRAITIAPDVSQAQRFATILHEIAHALLHEPDDDDRPDHRGIREVEAESVSYVVSYALGLDTSCFSFGYVAGWASSTDDPVQAVLDQH
jgi:hypothetical protein